MSPSSRMLPRDHSGAHSPRAHLLAASSFKSLPQATLISLPMSPPPKPPPDPPRPQALPGTEQLVVAPHMSLPTHRPDDPSRTHLPVHRPGPDAWSDAVRRPLQDAPVVSPGPTRTETR